MKKVTAILFISLMLASAFGPAIDRHFCGGRVVDVRLAIDDKRATCGMEQDGMECTHTVSIDENCCHNDLTTFTVDNYSIVSTLTVDKPFFSVAQVLFESPVNSYNYSYSTPVALSDTGPPGIFNLQPDQQSILCIFRN